MSMRLCDQLTSADERMVREATEGFVPTEVYDIHAHIFHSGHFAEGSRPAFLTPDTGYGISDYRSALARWLPGRKVNGLFFGYPSAGNNRVGENEFVASQVAAHPEMMSSRKIALVSPADGEEATRRLVTEKKFNGIKCYRLYASVADTKQARIEEFAPRWMWQICHEIKGVLMLHIMRGEGIADPDNLATLERFCREFPECRLVLAHVARSFNYRNARTALRKIERLDNVVVDTSAVTEAGAMRVALDALGPRRLLFGSDYMVSELYGKCFTMGDGFSWIYSDLLPAPAITSFENFPLVGVESVMCLREAFEDGGFNQQDAQDVFCDNALRLLAPHLEANQFPPSPRGPELWSRAKQSISCGTGLMAKRATSFDPVEWPSYYSRCSGANIWDSQGRRFTDFTGGVGAILLGHSDEDVNRAVHRRVSQGSYCTLVSPDEPALAEHLLALHPWAARVRFARGGGEALSLAVRIARAATGKSGIAFCGYHGWSDWYLAANLADDKSLDGHLLPGLAPLGVPRELAGTAVPFRYNDPASFQEALSRLGDNFAGVVMEPMRSEAPRDGFLQNIAATCKQRGAVHVMDEVTSGWRFGFPGASPGLGIEPDIAVYAKAMSNGFPAAAIVGRDGVMDAAEASFISSSYWTDGVGPAAALACTRKMERLGVQPRVVALGNQLQSGLREVAARHPSLKIAIGGQPCAPSIAFQLGEEAAAAKALMIRGMLHQQILFSSQLYAMWPHDEAMISSMLSAWDSVLGGLAEIQQRGGLREAAGSAVTPSGFARLA